MLARPLLRLVLTACLLVSSAAVSATGAQEVTGRIIEYGVYEAEIGQKSDAPGTISGRTNNITRLRHVRTAREIFGQLGLSFGMRFALDGGARPGDPLTFRVTHPPLTHPENGRGGRVDEWTSRVGANPQNQYVGYTFEEPWELAEGEWTFNVIYRGRVVATHSFMIRIPLN